MTAHAVAVVALWLGVAMTVLAALGMLVLRGVYERLHALAVASAVGAPLVGVALLVATGSGRELAKLAVIVAVVVIGGPVVTMSTARAAAQQEGRVGQESPR